MMKTLLKLCLIALALSQANLATAHAVVTDYSLKMQPIRANQADKVVMTFNSQVEIGLSQVFLVSKGDKHALLNIGAGEKQGQLIVEVPALPPGDYAIKFKVFAADGHLTEDVIHFSVAQ
jgi:methionine-rich copper-binding protein CopC